MAGQEKRMRCMVFSRVTGYLQPVESWNIGKQQEFADRKMYSFPQVGVVPAANPLPAPVEEEWMEV
jgi:hypothetical protein